LSKDKMVLAVIKSSPLSLAWMSRGGFPTLLMMYIIVSGSIGRWLLTAELFR